MKTPTRLLYQYNFPILFLICNFCLNLMHAKCSTRQSVMSRVMAICELTWDLKLSLDGIERILTYLLGTCVVKWV
ncbi:hypothetical protein L2E82_32108 [Cichorium intybus]|uniref:Uncharacterized protein n=1 Tax=Cichorium intybus TaxID=13427 RepID=A0ACB9BGP1_CICIN|nr:hypothetical protein L2E82_32108 [Cichorium intybus]